MVLGIIRILYLSVMARLDGSGPVLPPLERAINNLWLRSVYAISSTLVHVGLIVVPLFLIAHVRSWNDSLGFSWPPIEQIFADWLTIFVMLGLPLLTLLRIIAPGPASRRKPSEFILPLLLLLPFVSGYACSNLYLSAHTYQILMATHLYSASLILLLIPFSPMFHCVLEPISRLITGPIRTEILDSQETSR
jgi:hypothetical protein